MNACRNCGTHPLAISVHRSPGANVAWPERRSVFPCAGAAEIGPAIDEAVRLVANIQIEVRRRAVNSLNSAPIVSVVAVAISQQIAYPSRHSRLGGRRGWAGAADGDRLPKR